MVIEVEPNGSPRAEPGQRVAGPEVSIAADGAPPITLSRGPRGALRLTVEGDRCYMRVKVVRASPLTHPDRFVCFLDEKGVEIRMVKDLADLDATSRELAREALERFYVAARIEQVRSLRAEMGMTYWEVETDLGARDFAVKDIGENVLELSGGRVVLTDVHGNRYEIPDLAALEPRSRALVASLL